MKELVKSDGYVREISQENLELILKNEMEDLNTDRMKLVPKLVYLDKCGLYLNCNLIEFFTEEKGNLSYVTFSSVVYTDEISSNGKIFK